MPPAPHAIPPPLITALAPSLLPNPTADSYPFVLTGYRCGGTYARCAAALFELHAETFNAWTMVWGSCLSLLLLWHALGAVAAADGAAGGALQAAGSAPPPRFRPAASDAAPFWLMTAAVLLHAPWSVGFHLFRGISAAAYNLWRRLDQVFIFQVSQLLAAGIGWFVYESSAGLALNLAATVVVAAVACRDIWGLSPDFQRNRVHMVAFIGAIVVCYWAPMGVQLWRDVGGAALAALAAARGALAAGGGAAALVGAAAAAFATAPPSWAAAAYAAGTFAALAAGGAVFASGFPERWWPRRFDLFFSHVIMHVFAALAHALEYGFVLEMWRRRRAEAAAAAPVASVAAPPLSSLLAGFA